MEIINTYSKSQKNTKIAAEKNGRAGFTLIEVLVSVAILAFGLMSALFLQISSIKYGSQADHLTVASMLAESEIERLKTYTQFNEIPDAVSTSLEYLTREGEVCALGDSRCVYTRETTLEQGFPTTRSHSIVVKIFWNDALGKHELSYNAVITDFNMGKSGL
ncbi:MAG: prepilin-type N-terminal cleavage/methylation domain-containing protein [Deltaproteobacteria bacterium]|nr:prepilin-type N-terminal cleavage/methylation domain-containing protein [Deltaproteobacteria bacterium]